MELLKEFISNYKDVIHLSLVFIFMVVQLILLFKKKEVNFDNILVYLDKILPNLINQAESIVGSDNKMALVVKSAKAMTEKKFGCALSDKFIKDKVESYLDTPSKKKGAKDGKN